MLIHSGEIYFLMYTSVKSNYVILHYFPRTKSAFIIYLHSIQLYANSS
jgi:hypothetical protein